jgi:hypothetical protein
VPREDILLRWGSNVSSIRRINCGVVCTWLACLVVVPAHAQQGATAASGPAKSTAISNRFEVDAASYCRFVENVAASEAHVLVWPRLRASFGTFRGIDTDGAVTDQTELSARLMAGLEYDLFDVYRGATLNDRAEAECRRYRAVSKLRAFTQLGPQGETRSALQRRLAVLDAALPEAQTQAKQLESDLAAGRATLDELGAVERGLEALQIERLRISLAMEGLASDAPLDGSLPGLLEEQLRADAEVERYEGRLREIAAWSFSLNGGYDQVFREDDDVPIYAMATLTYSFGGLFQGAADARAAAARKAWVEAQPQGVRHEVTQIMQRLHALQTAEREQLALTTERVRKLDERRAALASISDDRARAYTRTLWFELVQARAQQAYLERHVEEIDGVLARKGSEQDAH